MVAEAAFDPAALRRREFRRFLVASLVVHAGLVVALGWTPSYETAIPLGAVPVELVAAPPSAAPPTPVEAVPAPPKPPPPPKPKKVVLPKDPTKDPLPKPSKKKVQKVEKKTPPPPEPPESKSLEDVMAQLRAQAGEERPTARPDPQPALGTGSPTGRPVSPEVAAWMRRAKLHVRKNWVVTPGFRTAPLETHIVVKLDAGGGVIGTPQIRKRSGNPYYDEGVQRAIQKSSPLPAPPEAGDWSFVFVPSDSY